MLLAVGLRRWRERGVGLGSRGGLPGDGEGLAERLDVLEQAGTAGFQRQGSPLPGAGLRSLQHLGEVGVNSKRLVIWILKIPRTGAGTEEWGREEP